MDSANRPPFHNQPDAPFQAQLLELGKTVNTTNMAKPSSVKQLRSVQGRQCANPAAQLIPIPVVGLMMSRLGCVGPRRTVVRDNMQRIHNLVALCPSALVPLETFMKKCLVNT